MWKEPSDASALPSDATSPVPAPISGADVDRPQQVKVRIERPDGTARDVVVAGHFREEHLCSLVDDELCRLDNGESLVLHLFHADEELTQSLRNRWQEGISDNRHVRVREVLGAGDSRQQLAAQLRRIRERIAAGERINLAIRSPRVAKVAREQLRKLLLVSQQFEEALLRLWVHGDEQEQREIMEHLEEAGLVLARDYRQFVEEHPDHRWRAPWLDVEEPRKPKKTKRRQQKLKSAGDAVSEWIRRVEEGREHPHH